MSSRLLVVTLPAECTYGLTPAAQEEFLETLRTTVDECVETGTPIIIGHGITIESVPLLDVRPGARVCCL